MLKEYFEGILLLAVLIALSIGISHQRLRNVTRFGAGVLLTCAILLPLVDIFKDFDGKDYVDEIMGSMEYENATDDTIEIAFENGVSEYIADKYGVDRSCVLVMADEFDMETVRAERIYITLIGEAALLDYKRIEEEISREFTSGGECEVSLKIG